MAAEVRPASPLGDQQELLRSERPAPGAGAFVPAGASLDELRGAARQCAGCDLYRAATQTVLCWGANQAGQLGDASLVDRVSATAVKGAFVATNVAETSVTIDGIRHVVDSGLARVARYDAERGISTLFLEEISRASAEQRKGRAGRTAPGTCYRLWTESGHLNRPERNTPEIQRSDLAEVVLLLHSLGIKRAAEFDWLDKPDPQAVDRAEKLLRTLGALGDLRIANCDLRAPEEAGAPANRESRNTAACRRRLCARRW